MKQNYWIFKSAIITLMLGMLTAVLPGCKSSPESHSAGNSDFFSSGLGNLPFMGQEQTRSISAENLTGERGVGGMAIPDPSEKKPAASARAADVLGQGWKV